MQDETPQDIIGEPEWASPSETLNMMESVGTSVLTDEERFYTELVMSLYRAHTCETESRNDPTGRHVQKEY